VLEDLATQKAIDPFQDLLGKIGEFMDDNGILGSQEQGVLGVSQGADEIGDVRAQKGIPLFPEAGQGKIVRTVLFFEKTVESGCNGGGMLLAVHAITNSSRMFSLGKRTGTTPCT
jgi:hypothetical protein